MKSAVSIKENTSSTSQAVDDYSMNSSVKMQQAIRCMPAGSDTEVGNWNPRSLHVWTAPSMDSTA